DGRSGKRALKFAGRRVGAPGKLAEATQVFSDEPDPLHRGMTIEVDRPIDDQEGRSRALQGAPHGDGPALGHVLGQIAVEKEGCTAPGLSTGTPLREPRAWL